MKLLLYFCNIMLFKISLALHCSKYCKDYQKYFEAKSKTSIFSTLVETSKQYDAQSITVLEGLDPVRKRPGMYIGSTGQKGLHHLVFEVVDNSIDEALAGYCTNITIQLNEDGSVMVEDNGRGIPCSLHPKTNKSALETVLCVLHAGGKFGGDSSGYKVSGGLHGVGISVVNALSEKMTVEVARDGNLHTLNLAKGVPLSSLKIEPLSAVSNSMIRGTRIVFKPDPIIFKTSLEFEYEKLANRIDELAYLNPGVTMTMIDNRKYIQSEIRNTEEDSMDTNQQSKLNLRNPRTQVFRHDGGIDELVKFLCQDKVNLHPELDVISINEEIKGVAIEISMRWSKDMYTDNIIGFANGIRTIDGGSHLDGLKAAITKTLNSCAKKTGKLKDSSNSIPGEFLREGLTAVVSAKVPEPEFEGQTKTRLGNPEIRQIVDQIVSRALETIFEWNPQTFNVIFSKAVDAQNAAIAAKAARDMVRKKSLLQSTILPGKLADCSSRDPAECEIYIVEGDSAAGSAKQGRDRKTQAILPLRGKILNIEKASNEKIYQNGEIQALISALGLGVRGSTFDSTQLRYHKIVIMSDADVDGSHIRLLLLTFFYRYQRELVENGFIYIACPPLYKLLSKSKNTAKEVYFYDQQELDNYLATLPPGSPPPQLQRFKGLGEMMPTQLWQTTMDPHFRKLKKINIDDAAAADRLLTVLMGDNVVVRKDFINTHSNRFSLEDLDF